MSRYTESIQLKLPDRSWRAAGKQRARRGMRLPERRGMYIYSFIEKKFVQTVYMDYRLQRTVVRWSETLENARLFHQRDAAALAAAQVRRQMPETEAQVVSHLAAWALEGIRKRGEHA